mgnify:CR=1 FL=1
MRVLIAKFPSIAMEIAMLVPAKHSEVDLNYLTKPQLIVLVAKLEEFIRNASEEVA